MKQNETKQKEQKNPNASINKGSRQEGMGEIERKNYRENQCHKSLPSRPLPSLTKQIGKDQITKASHRTDSHGSAAATKGREDAADTATLGNPTALEENRPIYTNHKLLRLNETKQDCPAAIKELNSSLKALEEDTDGFNWRTPADIYRIFTNFLQSLPETEKEEILLCSLREASVTLTPKPCRVQERLLEANISQELRRRNSQQSASRSSKKDLKNIQYNQIATIYPSYM